MRAVGIAETTLQKRPRSSYFDKPSEQSAGCRLVRTPEISVGIFSTYLRFHYLPFRAAGIGTEQVVVKSCFIQINTLVVGKFGQLCQIMRYFGWVLFFVSGGLFLRVIPSCLSA